MTSFEEYGEDVVAWKKDEDLLVVFTDGLSDAFSPDSSVSGEKNLVTEIVANRARHPQEILDMVFEEAENATLNIPPDDRTAIIVRG